MSRPDWDEYFLGIAKAVAARGECKRSQVGAVIVWQNRIVSTGYNGVGAGEASCLDGVCPREVNDVPSSFPYEGKGMCIAIHAELNAIKDAARRRLGIQGTTMYLTKEPCERCAGVLESFNMTVVWQRIPSLNRGSTTESEEFPQI